MSKRHDKDRVLCSYPMSMFYNFMDEVPDGARVSTTEDCEECNGCNGKNCLISP